METIKLKVLDQAGHTLMTQRRPQLSPGGLALEDLGVIRISSGAEISLQPVPVEDPRLRTAWPDTLWKISIYFYNSHDLFLE